MAQTQNKNTNIGCNVAQCRYNCKADQCCSLNQIDVVQEAKNANSEHATCCHSFECR
ncbi:MAG: DUF1540 domain-containing protein [Oscillospiraceae bacterium]|nr:DUF1540 domain-containing protein [Oscillospiraceae bacterium]